MKKHNWKKHFTISMSINVSVYLIGLFITLDFLWFIIGFDSIEHRAMLISLYFVNHLISWILIESETI